MANEEQLATLKQGVDVWNKWREENPDVKIDLREVNLRRANLVGAWLWEADLSKADLREADLRGAHCNEGDLKGANLSQAELSRADLSEANLSEANLSDANCWKTDLSDVNLSGANLSKADLNGANLLGAKLVGSKFSNARVGSTIFGKLDLRDVLGLARIVHSFPSIISADTLAKSQGKIPEVFLRGCGLSDWEIESARLYNPDLSNDERNRILYKIYDLQSSQAIQISPLFISYSHADSAFADKVGECLTEKGIRYWRDIHDMKAGRIERQIDHAIRQNPTVLLILSENSLNSDWVEHEVRTARSVEKEMQRDVLCPVALDECWKDSRWPKHVMEQVMEYNILDFSNWKDDIKFEGVFNKLIGGLELFYKG